MFFQPSSILFAGSSTSTAVTVVVLRYGTVILIHGFRTHSVYSSPSPAFSLSLVLSSSYYDNNVAIVNRWSSFHA